MGSAAYAASGVWAIAQSVATSLLSRLSSVARRAFFRLTSLDPLPRYAWSRMTPLTFLFQLPTTYFLLPIT